MALDYDEEFQLEKRKLFISVCIYEKPGFGNSSPVNRLLEQLHHEFLGELENYEEIQIAYVYETDGLMDVRDFEPVTEKTPIMYKEPCNRMETHNINHVFFMGMAMLERVQNIYDTAEKRLYFVTDEKFERINNIVYETGRGIQENPRFKNLDVRIIPVKEENSDAGGDTLEIYMKTAQTRVC